MQPEYEMPDGLNLKQFGEDARRFVCFLWALLYRKGARRIAVRRYKILVLYALPQPHVAWLSVVMLHNGINLLVSGGNGTVKSPPVFGVLLVALAFTGLISIGARQSGLMACFAAGGFVVRFSMFLMYLFNDWRDQVWGSYFIGAVMCAWIFSRVACDVAAKRPFRILQFHTALCNTFGVKDNICKQFERCDPIRGKHATSI